MALVFSSQAHASGVLQGMINYYAINNGTNFTMSTTSFTGTEWQTANPDGTVTVGITNAQGYADSGFVIFDGKLGDLDNFSLTGTGNEYGLNLWFDTNDNGTFFSWSGADYTSNYSGLGGDKYILGPTSVSGAMNITDSSPFQSLLPDGGNYTLAELKAGVAGITSDTHIAIWVGVNVGSGESKSTTISILVPSPTDKSQCLKGSWKNFNDPPFKNQGDCVSFVQSNWHAVGNKLK